MKNVKFVPIASKSYEVKYVENKKTKLSPAARNKIINRSGSNYLSSWSETCISETVGYGPMEKWCDKCNSAKDVSKNAYECPSCNAVFGAMIERNEEKRQFNKKNMKLLVELLTEKNLTLASCESLTGGLFATSLTEVAGASKVLKGGFVVYSNEAKNKLAKVSFATLEEHGAVSEQCAQEMALNTQQLLETDLAISFTGNAGPGKSENKEVGLVFIGLAIQGCPLISKRYQFSGSREEIREQVIKAGIELIKNIL